MLYSSSFRLFLLFADFSVFSPLILYLPLMIWMKTTCIFGCLLIVDENPSEELVRGLITEASHFLRQVRKRLRSLLLLCVLSFLDYSSFGVSASFLRVTLLKAFSRIKVVLLECFIFNLSFNIDVRYSI